MDIGTRVKAVTTMRFINKAIFLLWTIFVFVVIYFIQSFWLQNSQLTKSRSALENLAFSVINVTTLMKDGVSSNNTTVFVYPSNGHLYEDEKTKSDAEKNLNSQRITSDVVLAVVACNDRLHETLVMIKSAILFSGNVKLKLVVIADLPLINGFEEKLLEWRSSVNNSFEYKVHPITFPDTNKEEWRKLFKPCAAQRLFLPSLLKDTDSVLYVDTDTLFLGPLEDVWVHFSRMNSTQMAALAPEHEDPNTGWYNRFARHPYYGELGVNSGVMLMNLTRMRQFGWGNYLAPIYKEFKLKITWGDQDIINIIFHYHPERLYVYSCRYNYRSDHCMYMSVCKDANKNGVAVIHGSRSTFHGDKQPAFKAVFSCMEEYQLGLDPYQNLLLPMENALEQTSHTNCGKVRSILTQNLHKYISVKETFS